MLQTSRQAKVYRNSFSWPGGRAPEKSTLIRKLRDCGTRDRADSLPSFVCGKFDDTRATGRPFEALRTACGEEVLKSLWTFTSRLNGREWEKQYARLWSQRA